MKNKVKGYWTSEEIQTAETLDELYSNGSQMIKLTSVETDTQLRRILSKVLKEQCDTY